MDKKTPFLVKKHHSCYFDLVLYFNFFYWWFSHIGNTLTASFSVFSKKLCLPTDQICCIPRFLEGTIGVRFPEISGNPGGNLEISGNLRKSQEISGNLVEIWVSRTIDLKFVVLLFCCWDSTLHWQCTRCTALHCVTLLELGLLGYRLENIMVHNHHIDFPCFLSFYHQWFYNWNNPWIIPRRINGGE